MARPLHILGRSKELIIHRRVQRLSARSPKAAIQTITRRLIFRPLVGRSRQMNEEVSGFCPDCRG